MLLDRSVAVILSVASVIAAASFVLIHHSEKSLEFAISSIGTLEPSGMDISMDVCNPSLVPVTLDGVDGQIGTSSGQYGSIQSGGHAVPPLSKATVSGRMNFDNLAYMKGLVDGVLSNGSGTGLYTTVHVRERLLGIIPYSYDQNYSVQEFSHLVFGTAKWSCPGQPSGQGEIRHQLEADQMRLSAANLLYLGRGAGENNTENSMNETSPGILP